MQTCLENILNICIQYRRYVVHNLVRIIFVICISIIQAYALHSKDNFYRGCKYARDLNTVAPTVLVIADVVVLNCVGGRTEDVYFSNRRKRKLSTCVKILFTIHLQFKSMNRAKKKKKEESILGITIHPIFPSLSVFLFKNPMLPFSVRTANQIFFFLKEKKKRKPKLRKCRVFQNMICLNSFITNA